MSSFIFNSFKKRFLEGNVPKEDNWTFIPVSERFKEYEFNDVRLDQYRGLSDFAEVKPDIFSYECDTSAKEAYIKGKNQEINIADSSFKIRGEGLIDGVINYTTWQKSTEADKPDFITTSNSAAFMSLYSKDIFGLSANIKGYISNGGFYYIQSTNHLNWFAKRSLKNNRIKGVFGNDLTAQISEPIGNDEKIPYEGTLDGNCHKLTLQIKGRSTDCGLVGVLGKSGIVRNFKLKGKYFDNIMECDKQITLNYIKKDGRDINCGMLVGRNYGTVEYIDADFPNFNLYAFVPSVYSVTNKSDKYKWNEKNNIVREKYDGDTDNFFYLNSFCINSPANICPYVGYFNEGKFSEGADFFAVEANANVYSDDGQKSFTGMEKYFGNLNVNYSASDENVYEAQENLHKLYYPIMGNFWANTENDMLSYNESYCRRDIKYPVISNTAIDNEDPDYTKNKTVLIKNPYYYGLDAFGNFTVRAIGTTGSNWNRSTVNYNSNLIKRAMGSLYTTNTNLEPSYEATRCSLRMHPHARAAYNIGTIVGANFGKIDHVQVHAIVKNTSNFVGFIGGLVGKQVEGNISNVSVYMNNTLNYDLGNKPENGDIVFYKQTPILPSVIKDVITSAGLNKEYYNVDKFYRDYFDPWYEQSGFGYKQVSTASTITDDVIEYKLRPIFVIGGLIGRYTPSNWTSTVSNTTVIYKDNYSTSNVVKRAENAFGVLVGKVDYSTQSYSMLYNYSMMNVNNCKFSAISNVGEPFTYYEASWQNGYWTPKLIEVDTTTSSIRTGTVTSKFVGVYELKNNVYDPIASNVNGQERKNFSAKQSIMDFGLYYAGDYPIDMLHHNGGLVNNHCLASFVDTVNDEAARANCTFTNANGDRYTFDIHHNYFNFPNNIPAINTPTNNCYIKRDMASLIISLNGCYSNVQRYIQVYEDYANQWDFMKIPSYVGNAESTSSYFVSAAQNKFNKNDIEILRRYWSRNKTNDGKLYNNPNLGDWCGISEIEGVQFKDCSGYFLKGLPLDSINYYTMLGTQNTFDGYTSVELYRGSWYNDVGWYNVGDVMHSYNVDLLRNEYLTANECNTYISSTSSYTIGRRFKKNILPYLNNYWGTRTGVSISFENRVNFYERSQQNYLGNYTHYSVNSNTNDIVNTYNTISNAFGYTIPVRFNNYNNIIGYSTNTTDYEKLYNLSATISLGEYITPFIIEDQLNKSTVNSYTTTSVSSNNGFGGILVVDSSGRNVMFLDNESNTPLTGNIIIYPTINPTTADKYILRIS